MGLMGGHLCSTAVHVIQEDGQDPTYSRALIHEHLVMIARLAKLLQIVSRQPGAWLRDLLVVPLRKLRVPLPTGLLPSAFKTKRTTASLWGRRK